MGTIDILPISWLPFVVAPFVLLWLLKVGLDFLAYHQPGGGGFGKLYADFMDDARARGLTRHEAMAEWRVREEFVRLRRVASERVAADLPRWFEHLEAAKREALERLAAEDAAMPALLAGMLRDLPYNHVLYPEVSRRVSKLADGRRGAPTPDQIAALRIVKPG